MINIKKRVLAGVIYLLCQKMGWIESVNLNRLGFALICILTLGFALIIYLVLYAYWWQELNSSNHIIDDKY